MNSNILYKEAFDALLNYCNYQERCTSEVFQKLNDFEIDNSEKERLINELKDSNFLNDERFAEAFIGGKFRIKRWGKNKIKAALRAKHISDEMIYRGFEKTIQLEEYQSQLEILFIQKWKRLKNKKDMSTRGKMFRYLYGKGYESDLINQLFNTYFLK